MTTPRLLPHRALRLLLALLVYLVVLSITANAQRHTNGPTVGMHIGMAGAPTALTLGWQPRPQLHLEAHVGNTHLANVMGFKQPTARERWVAGFNVQPRWFIGDGPIDVALYADFGLRARFHPGTSNTGTTGFSLEMGSPESPSRTRITPDVVAGTGVLFRFSDAIEGYAGLGLHRQNTTGSLWVTGLESTLGFRVLL